MAIRAELEVLAWRRAGRPVPPPHIVKQRTLRRYARQYGLTVLVETGTYLGEMVDAMQPDFKRIYSIELSEELHAMATERFGAEPSIVLVQGDSGVELARIVELLDAPALFWLDGHYSEGITAKGPRDTPVVEELMHIYSDGALDHVVIIDDAREFGSDPAYPTLSELKRIVHGMRPSARVDVKDDSIRITPGA
jgi:hypothetical protein